MSEKYDWPRIHKAENNIEQMVNDWVFEHVLEHFGVDEIEELTEEQIAEVQSFRDDFDDMAPSIRRLVTIEKDIKELHGQLKILIEGDLTNNTTNDAEKPTVKNTTEIKAPTPPKKVVKTTVKTRKTPLIRAADHSNKTRIVIETSKKHDYKISFDKENQLVMVDIPFSLNNAKGITRQSKRLKDAVLTSQASEGQSLAISTSNAIQRLSKGHYIGPSTKNRNHRYYFDLEL